MNLVKLINKLRSDFILVLSANIFSYWLNFCAAVIYVRLLGKTEFGIYTFAFSVISLFLLVNGFGAASGVLQYVSKAKSKQEQLAYLNLAFKCGTIFNLLIGLLIIGYASVAPLPFPNARLILSAMAFFPVGRLYIDIIQAYLRALGQHKLQARFLIINNSILLISSIIGILSFKLYGLIFATYLAYLIMFIYSSLNFKLAIFTPSNYSKVTAKQFIYYSIFATLANAFSGLIFVIDALILSYVIKDPKLVAVYKVATIIPFAINFIPNLMVNFYYPQFVRLAAAKMQLQQFLAQLRKKMLIFSSMVSLGLILLAKPLINCLFGFNYQASIVPFQIISAGFWIIASFRTLNGSVLAALGHAKLSFYLTSIILIINLVLTYFLIANYAILGAALGVVVMYIISSVIGAISLKLVLS